MANLGIKKTSAAVGARNKGVKGENIRMTNKDIYIYADKLQCFYSCDIIMPVKINFYLNKNIELIRQAANNIELARLNIGKRFGVRDNDGYIIQNEHLIEAENEINNLFNLEQDLPIHIFKLSDLESIELTYQQMSAIMFMVEED